MAFSSTAELTFQEGDSPVFYVDVELTLAGNGSLECDVEAFLQIVNSTKAGMLLSQVTYNFTMQTIVLAPVSITGLKQTDE